MFASIEAVPVLDEQGGVESRTTPHGVVVVSQTCDAVREGVPTVAVAPVVLLTGSEVSLARSGRSPRYAALPALGGDYFARLDTIATVSKELLRLEDRRSGIIEARDEQRFREGIGRRFARFAFPDDVAAWLAPIQRLAQKRAGKRSPEGQIFDRVDEIRIQAVRGWGSPPYDLSVSLIVQPGVLPSLGEDDVLEAPADLIEWLPGKGAPEIAERLLLAQDDGERTHLWDALGRAWVRECVRGDDGTSSCVASFDVEVVGADEYTLEQYRSSERLDLDHLSSSPSGQ